MGLRRRRPVGGGDRESDGPVGELHHHHDDGADGHGDRTAARGAILRAGAGLLQPDGGVWPVERAGGGGGVPRPRAGRDRPRGSGGRHDVHGAEPDERGDERDVVVQDAADCGVRHQGHEGARAGGGRDVFRPRREDPPIGGAVNESWVHLESACLPHAELYSFNIPHTISAGLLSVCPFEAI